MHPAVGNYKFVRESLTQVSGQLAGNTPEAREAIGAAIGSNDATEIESVRAKMSAQLSQAALFAKDEPSHQDAHFVSRVDLVGLFQAVLARVFNDIPDLQGYGDKNPFWLTTIIEQVTYDLSTFFRRVYTDVHGNKKPPLLHSIIAEWRQLQSEKAPFPPGVPATIPLPERTTIVTLGRLGWRQPSCQERGGYRSKA